MEILKIKKRKVAMTVCLVIVEDLREK